MKIFNISDMETVLTFLKMHGANEEDAEIFINHSAIVIS